MGLALQTYNYYDNSGGLDLKSSLTKTKEDDATASLNADYATDGAVFSRNGSSRLNDTQIDQLNNLGFYDYKKSDSTAVQVFQNGSKIYHDLTTPVAQVTSLDSSAIPDFEFIVTNDDEYLLWGNGVDENLKFDGTTWTNLSLPTPTNPTFNAFGAGALINGEYIYYVAFARQVGGVTVQIGDLNPTPLSVTVGAGPQSIVINIPTSADTQVNARIIYRASPTSLGVFYKQGVVANNVATTFTDAVDTDGTIEAEYDNQPAPTSAIFEELGGKIYFVDAANSTDLYESKSYKPWNVPDTNYTILDGAINCLKRIYNVLLISTSNGTLWVLDGALASNYPRRISSNLGVLNNRCIDGPGPLYMIATNKKFYTLQPPTDFEQRELRITEPFSIRIEPLVNQISNAALDKVQVKYYASADQGKLMITCPVGLSTNNALIIYNETQTFQKEKPCWHFWDNISCASLGIFKISGAINLYAGDYNGFLWKLDDVTTNGDGAQINGTATSATTSTLTENLVSGTATSGGASSLTDNTKALTVNAYSGDYIKITAGTGSGQANTIVSNTATVFTVLNPWGVVPDATSVYKVGPFPDSDLQGVNVRVIDGTGVDQNRIIISNDVDTLTISSGATNWSTTPDSTSEYSVGGYDNYHFTNWKSVTGSYDALKQLWFFISNLNASGDYTIQLIIQFDFDTTQTNQTVLNINLQSANTIWEDFIWEEAPWGAQSVFEDRKRIYGRFRAVRFGFKSRKAGQPWQLNGFSASVQDKGLFYKAA